MVIIFFFKKILYSFQNYKIYILFNIISRYSENSTLLMDKYAFPLTLLEHLCSCSIWSVVVIITKFAARVDSAFTILSYQYTLVTFLSFPIALYFWQSPSSQTLIYLIFAGIAGTIVHLCINTAYKLTDLSVLQPVNFSRLLIASLFGFLIFDEIPDIWTIIGGLIIFSSILIITYRENYLKKRYSKAINSS